MRKSGIIANSRPNVNKKIQFFYMFYNSHKKNRK